MMQHEKGSGSGASDALAQTDTMVSLIRRVGRR